MSGYRLSVLIDRPLPEVFDYVATHHAENHPTWEPEVLAMRSVERSLTFDIAFHFAPQGPEKTELITAVDIAASGLLRPLESIINALFRRCGVSRVLLALYRPNRQG